MAVFEPIFRALNDGGVRYVVVGGLAVVLHGHPRLTVDVDLVVDLDPTEARKAIDVLVATGLRPRAPVNPRDFADRSVRESWIRDHGMQVFSMFDPSNPTRVVDLFADPPIRFEDLWKRSEEFVLRGTTVRAASIPDLIELKRRSGPRGTRPTSTSSSRSWRRKGGVRMGEPAGRTGAWDPPWEGARRQLLESALAATPAQRLAWLEEILEFARDAGALGPRPAGPGPASGA